MAIAEIKLEDVGCPCLHCKNDELIVMINEDLLVPNAKWAWDIESTRLNCEGCIEWVEFSYDENLLLDPTYELGTNEDDLCVTCISCEGKWLNHLIKHLQDFNLCEVFANADDNGLVIGG